jgi:hypothetical protein
MRFLAITTRPLTAPRIPSQEEIDRTVALMKELGENGSLVDAGGTWPGLLEMKIERKADDYSIVDGPFTEAKEVVGGYLLFDVPDREAAIAFTRRFLDVTGEGTLYLHELVVFP